MAQNAKLIEADESRVACSAGSYQALAGQAEGRNGRTGAAARSGRWRGLLGDEHLREVLHGASIALALKLLGAALAFGFNVALARLLGAEGAGEYFLTLSVVTIATVFGRVGLDNVLVRFVASNTALDDSVRVKGVYRRTMATATVASLTTTLVVLAAAPVLAGSLFGQPELTPSIRLMALAIVPMTMFLLHAEALKGLKRIFAAVTVQTVTVSGLGLVLLFGLAQRFGVGGAIGAHVLAASAAAALGWALWVRATPRLRGVSGEFPMQTLLHAGVPLLSVTFMTVLMTWTGSIGLGVWSTKADVGVFTVAQRTALLINMVLIAVNSIAGPKFAALYAKGNHAALQHTVRHSARLMVAWAAPLTAVCVLAPGPVMRLFGSDFAVGGVVLAVIALGQFVNVAAGSMGKLLMMSGHERAYRNVIAISAVANLILIVVLVPRYAALGAAVATALTVVIQNALATVAVDRLLNISLFRSQ